MGHYNEYYEQSLSFLDCARSVTPGGAQTLSKRAERFPEGAFPVALDRGEGAYVWDVDDHKYLDFICGLASMTLGYSNSEVQASVLEQLKKGVTFSLATDLELLVAQKIVGVIPCADMVRFVKTGSEATEAAIRIARKATGRDIIVTVKEGYHSWHSWFQVVKDQHPGVPEFYADGVATIAYNDIEALAWHFGVFGERIAAVILEPCHYEHPKDMFLPAIQKLCTENGSLLIFDEMVTGFRWSYAGAQEYFNVIPDLATFGKACANGYPLAFVCGKEEYMHHADVVSGTFGGEALSLAACRAVLDVYDENDVTDKMWQLGRELQDGFNIRAKESGVPVVCDGYAVKPRIRFTIGQTVGETYGAQATQYHGQCYDPSILAMSLFLQELAYRGVLWHPAGGNISYAMSEAEIALALIAMRESLVVVKAALETGDFSKYLHGKPIQQISWVRQ